MAGKAIRDWFQRISQWFAPSTGSSDLVGEFIPREIPNRNNSSQPNVNIIVATDAERNDFSQVSNFSHFPDFSTHGYQVLQALGYNYAGGRSTYLATDTQTQQPVAIKQFQFAKPGANWSAYKAHEREIQVLRTLSHPGIPRYLDSFETAEGFCLVHEYKNAQSLAVPRRLDPEKIKRLAIAVLEILVYLQNRVPAVIHRDIKPENILLDDRSNVFLIDFGFARIGGGEVMQSSVVSGTPGFMPPEQWLNRTLTDASDLYGLGATLIALLTQTTSANITTLVDSSYRIDFAHLVPHLSDEFVRWLETMVQPDAGDRFPHAAAALEAIAPITPCRTLPEVSLSHTIIELTGKQGEILTHKIAIKNVVPDTLLQGRWEVAPSPDRPGAYPEWISIEPDRFEANEIECTIAVQTMDLVADRRYDRNILLHSNTATQTQIFPVTIRVSPASALTVAEPTAIAKSPAISRFQAVLFGVAMATPLTLVSPYVAIAVALPLALLSAREFSDKIQDKTIDRVAEVSQKWLMAPALAVLGIWFVSQLGIHWLEHPEIKLLTLLLLGMGMGGVGIAILDGYKAIFKRAIVALPLVIFGSSFVLIGMTTGLAGKIAEVGVTALVVSSVVKQDMQEQKIGWGLAVRKFGLTAALGMGVGTGLTWLLLYLGIGSFLW